MKKRVLAMVFFIIAVSVFGEVDNWERLKKRADEIYNGYSLQFDIYGNSSVESSDEGKADTNGSAGISFKVPLYSKEERMRSQTRKMDFLKRGSELLQTIEVNRGIIVQLREKERLLKSVMGDQGLQGIEAYYACKRDIAERESTVKSAEREFEILVK